LKQLTKYVEQSWNIYSTKRKDKIKMLDLQVGKKYLVIMCDKNMITIHFPVVFTNVSESITLDLEYVFNECVYLSTGCDFYQLDESFINRDKFIEAIQELSSETMIQQLDTDTDTDTVIELIIPIKT
jgi:hypothetical protein